MKERVLKAILATAAAWSMAAPSMAQPKKDAPNCKDHPLLARLQDYWIESCAEKQLDAYKFETGKGRHEVEGRFWNIRYQPPAGLSSKPSILEILRNFQATIKKAGGDVVASDSSKETLTVRKDAKETWVEVWADHTGKYILTIVERASAAPATTAAPAASSKGAPPPPPQYQIACPGQWHGRFWFDEVQISEPNVPGAGAPAPVGWSKVHVGGSMFELATFVVAKIENVPGSSPDQANKLVCGYKVGYAPDTLPRQLQVYMAKTEPINPAKCRKANPNLWGPAGSVPVDQQKPNGPMFQIMACSAGVNPCIISCDR